MFLDFSVEEGIVRTVMCTARMLYVGKRDGEEKQSYFSILLKSLWKLVVVYVTM